MIKDIEVISLKVEDIIPPIGKVNVDVNTPISIKFNSYINKATIVGNIFLTKDKTGERISCNIKNENDVVTLVPKSKLDNDEVYCVNIKKNTLSDLLGRKMLIDFKSTFTTTSNSSSCKPNIVYPESTIYSSFNHIKFESVTETNIIEISNSKSFNLIIYSKLIKDNEFEVTHMLENSLSDGLYYVRVRNEDNNESEAIQFYISSGEGRVSNDDYAVEVSDLGIDEENELIGFSPSSEFVDTNRNCIYFKFKGKVSVDDIKKCKSYVYGKSIDESIDEITEHGYVDYNLIYMYDSLEDTTYVIFELNKEGDLQ